MNRSMLGLPVHHQLPEFTQTQVHRVGDAIQPSHPLSSPSPPAPNPSQHQSLFRCPVLILSNAACTSLPSPRLLVADAGVCAASPLRVTMGHVICVALIVVLFLGAFLTNVVDAQESGESGHGGNGPERIGAGAVAFISSMISPRAC